MAFNVQAFVDGAADIHCKAASVKDFKTQIRVLIIAANRQGAADAREEDLKNEGNGRKQTLDSEGQARQPVAQGGDQETAGAKVAQAKGKGGDQKKAGTKSAQERVKDAGAAAAAAAKL